jgi:hypothetical protein
MKESLVLLALAALALLVAPSYPLVYGAGAVAAALVMGVPLLRSRKSPFAKACKPIPTLPLEEVREAGGVSRRKPRPL